MLVVVPLVAVPLIAISLVAISLVAISRVTVTLIIWLIPICLAFVRLTTNGRWFSLRSWWLWWWWCRCHCSVVLSKGLPARLHLFGVNAGSTTWWSITLAGLLPPIVVDIFKIKRVYVARQVSENRQEYVDDQIHSTSCYSPDAERREDNGDEYHAYDRTNTHDGGCDEV